MCNFMKTKGNENYYNIKAKICGWITNVIKVAKPSRRDEIKDEDFKIII